MNNRQKGNQFQNWIALWFQQSFPGCAVHNQTCASTLVKFRDKRTGVMKEVWVSKRNDILGCIDLIVMVPGKKPIYIQATLDSGVNKRLEELSPVPWNLDHCTVQLWQKRENGEIHIKEFTGDGFKEWGKVIRRKFYKLEEESES